MGQRGIPTAPPGLLDEKILKGICEAKHRLQGQWVSEEGAHSHMDYLIHLGLRHPPPPPPGDEEGELSG